MAKESFNRIVDAIEVKYVLASKREVIEPVGLADTIEQKDILIMVNSGNFFAGKKQERITEDTVYLIPKGSTIYFQHGASPVTMLGPEGFTSSEQRERFLRPMRFGEEVSSGKDIFTILGFEVLIHGAIPFFSILDLPPVMIGKHETISSLLQRILEEESHFEVGRNSLIRKYTEEIIIHICRYIYGNPMFSPQTQKLEYLLDKRLIRIIQYIQDNLEQDLSNNIIAELVFVSKDYIGQFFKSLTNTNLQDYIENRRLEHAHYLLRTTSDNIQEIAHRVGFKDPAYFSRRFKMKFHQNAKEVRKYDYSAM